MTEHEHDPECERVNKRLAVLIAKRSGEQYRDVIRHIRNRLRFALLRATVIAVRGMLGKVVEEETEVDEISFNLVPSADVE